MHAWGGRKGFLSFFLSFLFSSLPSFFFILSFGIGIGIGMEGSRIRPSLTRSIYLFISVFILFIHTCLYFYLFLYSGFFFFPLSFFLECGVLVWFGLVWFGWVRLGCWLGAGVERNGQETP